KSDIGGVALDVADGEALIAATRRISAAGARHCPAARVARVLVQPMVGGLGEALLGYRVDRDVGPLIVLAAGGMLAEIARDRSLRLPPAGLDTPPEETAGGARVLPPAGHPGRPQAA